MNVDTFIHKWTLSDFMDYPGGLRKTIHVGLSFFKFVSYLHMR